MASSESASLGHGTVGSPQSSVEEQLYPSHQNALESEGSGKPPAVYDPSPKHEPGHNWGTENPIKSKSEGQHLLDTGYHDGKQVYNVTEDGVIVKFQPDNSPNNGYHSYKVTKPRDIPTKILKQMLADGKISRTEYNKFRKGKK